ncbi:hypothetical protein B0H11DRAFT_2236588 [Mycena galericulata]|nr:hypothetical protein B0H11DRAFT_2236588 [Mycena galericulata]
MHRRFVTLATTQKASRNFDAIRYKPEEGPMKLMDNLVSASRWLWEPMPDFMIRKTFLKLIPDSMSDMMILHRGLNTEYSTIQQLRFHANHIWDANNHQISHRNRTVGHSSLRPGPATPNTRGESTPKRTATCPTPAVGAPRASPVPNNGHVPTAQTTPATSNAAKQCFKCGIVGHIASDKICPQHAEHGDRPRVGLAAQRVPDSYAEDDYVIPEEGPEDGLVDDNWGGSQYNHEDIDDGPGPTADSGDLRDLIDFDQVAEPRAGAMQFQYFSLRIEPEDSDESAENATHEAPPDTSVNLRESTPHEPVRELQGIALTELEMELAEIPYLDVPASGRTIKDLWGPSAEVDVGLLNDIRMERGLPEFTREEHDAKQRQLVQEHEYPISRWTTFDELAYKYQVLQGNSPTSRSATEEWEIILEYDASVHARTTLHSIWIPRPIGVSVSTATLSGRTAPLEREADRCDEAVNEIDTALESLTEVQAHACAELTAAEYRRDPSRRRARQVLGRIREIYHSIVEEVRDRTTDLEARATRLRAIQEVILDELDRRAVPEHEPGTARVTEDDSGDDRPPSPDSPPPGV